MEVKMPFPRALMLNAVMFVIGIVIGRITMAIQYALMKGMSKKKL